MTSKALQLTVYCSTFANTNHSQYVDALGVNLLSYLRADTTEKHIPNPSLIVKEI